MNDFTRALDRAMLAWLQARLYEGETPDDDWPVRIIGWEETGYVPAACDTCGPDWPTVTIDYETRGGRELAETVDVDFATFLRQLTDMKED